VTPQPVAYIRRSAADAGSPGEISREVQTDAVRKLAASEGHKGELRIFTDWARSADEEKTAKRSQYAAMLKAVENGEVSTIYAYALDRLLRSVIMTGKLLQATKVEGVRIVTAREGDLTDKGNPSKWLFTMLVSMFSEYELRTAKARAAGGLAKRRKRGDYLGRAPFGHRLVHEQGGRIVVVPDPADPLRPVLDAVREAGTVLGACRLLQERGVPAPKGGRRWSTAALTRILQREAPELLRPRGPTGQRGAGVASPLTGLLRCHCGQTLTPNVKHGQFYCSVGHRAGAAAHGKMTATVATLMPWIREEAARLELPMDAVLLGEAAVEQRAALTERRQRIADAAIDGLISRDEAKERAAEIDSAMADLDAQEQIAELPQTISWEADSATVNELLRAMWRGVQLDDQMRPVRAEWVKPEWRS
jgi:DNA invertase Pin-like site-specific DNA recombinase